MLLDHDSSSDEKTKNCVVQAGEATSGTLVIDYNLNNQKIKVTEAYLEYT